MLVHAACVVDPIVARETVARARWAVAGGVDGGSGGSGGGGASTNGGWNMDSDDSFKRSYNEMGFVLVHSRTVGCFYDAFFVLHTKGGGDQLALSNDEGQSNENKKMDHFFLVREGQV